MRIRLPSFRSQILILVLFLLFNSVFFLRNYFLDSIETYSRAVESLNSEQDFNHLYQTYGHLLPDQEQEAFKKDIESMAATQRQNNLARSIFKKEVALYSKFIFVFLSVVVLILFFISFNLITRPLNRLQAATNELSKGNWSIQVPESRFSPLNDLIVSFNTMIRELESNRNKLIQAEKESAWRDLARIMAHEIKNPLTPMRLSLERLEQKYALKAPEFEAVFSSALAVMQEEISNLQRFASEFSQFAKLPKAEPVDYDLNQQLTEIVQPYQEQAEIHLNFALEHLRFHGDKTQMKQVFTNLIQNAIQSSPENCVLQISTRSKEKEIKIILEDNGPGIRAEDLGKIFDPYFTKRTKGTGLGLSIVKRIVEGHGGVIQVDSTPGKGTRFTLYFSNQNPESVPQ
jgi:nitrogen fixation/metabolism regulation signal transduction histidine kinase